MLLRLWIGISVLASLAGWILSALGQLNRIGYLLILGVGAATCIWWWANRDSRRPGSAWIRFKARFRRPLPLAFVILAALVLLGGLLYPPSNHTALSYRTPRVLHWLAEGQWHWIHTPNYRMNNRACGIEWLSAPILLFTQTDRFVVLLNYLPWLLLPGLIFSVSTRLGVSPRVSRQWMWLMPTGYNFLLQAASAGNDTFPTVYALAAVDFAARARISKKPSDLWYSILAAALLTGAKASNLPLLLPWALLLIPLHKIAFSRPLLTAGVAILAAAVSFLPTALLNIKYVGDWSGLNLERTGMNMKNPFVGIWGNALLLLLSNFAPPFFPFAGSWNREALGILPHQMVAPLVANFEEGFHVLGELPTEDWAGLGLGVSGLLLLSLLARLVCRRPTEPIRNQIAPPILRRAAATAPWVSLLAYCMKSGMVTGARLISPYYPLLLPVLTGGRGPAKLVRSRLWRVATIVVLAAAFAVLVVTPGRPLWPAQTVLRCLEQSMPTNRQVARALSVYSVYSVRSDPLKAMREQIPSGVKTLGFIGTEDDIDVSLWRPFGSRRICHFLADDSADRIRERAINFVVVGGFVLGAHGLTLDQWLERVRGEVVATITATQKVSEGPQKWYLVKLKP